MPSPPKSAPSTPPTVSIGGSVTLSSLFLIWFFHKSCSDVPYCRVSLQTFFGCYNNVKQLVQSPDKWDGRANSGNRSSVVGCCCCHGRSFSRESRDPRKQDLDESRIVFFRSAYDVKRSDPPFCFSPTNSYMEDFTGRLWRVLFGEVGRTRTVLMSLSTRHQRSLSSQNANDAITRSTKRREHRKSNNGTILFYLPNACPWASSSVLAIESLVLLSSLSSLLLCMIFWRESFSDFVELTS